MTPRPEAGGVNLNQMSLLAPQSRNGHGPSTGASALGVMLFVLKLTAVSAVTVMALVHSSPATWPKAAPPAMNAAAEARISPKVRRMFRTP